MRSGPSVLITYMPWGAFKRTDDQDLQVIYRYLMLVKPVEKYAGSALQDLVLDSTFDHIIIFDVLQS